MRIYLNNHRNSCRRLHHHLHQRNNKMSNTKNYISSSLLAGTVIALLSAIPYLSSLNLCCCLWHIVGGFWAAYLFWWSGKKISLGQSIGIGIFTGIWTSFVYSILTAILWGAMSEQFLVQMNNILQSSSSEIPPEMMDLITELSSSPLIMFLVVFAVTVMIFPVVITIGSIFGHLILKKKNSAEKTTTVS